MTFKYIKPLFCLLLFACDTVTHDFLSLKDNLHGKPGVIGDVSYEQIDETHPLIHYANNVGTLLLLDNTTQKNGSGVGVFVRRPRAPDVLILTAKHNIYDSQTGKLKGDTGFFDFELR